jgi:hypothetical protein
LGENLSLELHPQPKLLTYFLRSLQAALESNGNISKAQAIALATINIEKALGLPSRPSHDIVAYSGGNILDFHSKVVAVVSAQRRVVDILDE